MPKPAIALTSVLFGLIVVGMFLFAYVERTNAPADSASIAEPVVEENESTQYDSITRVTAKKFYIDGIYTLVGEVVLPTPCDLLESEALVAESMPEQVTVDFTVINNSETCVQQVTAARFMTSFEASAEADIQARFQGRKIEFNLIPAAPGETPEEFELFIKG